MLLQGLAISLLVVRPRVSRPRCSADDSDGGLHSLLLQRAIQTCCINARTVRDPPTAQWLARFTGIDEQFHGLAQLRRPWRTMLSELLAAPTECIQVESVLKKHRSLSASNPYLQPKAMTYEYELRPSELFERVVLATELIAREWREDLSLMEAENANVWLQRSAFVMQDDRELKETHPHFEVDQDSNTGSAYRAGNYELLQCIATRQAAQNAVCELRTQATRGGEARLLAEHLDSAADFQVGCELPHNAADVWLSVLLDRPMLMNRGATDGAAPSFVDPRAIADLVLNYRATVAAEWIELLAEVPEQILVLRREHLTRQSGL